MKLDEAKFTIEAKLKKSVDANPKLLNAFLLIHSEKLNIHWNMAHGTTGDIPANMEQPYHTASIGKTFTALIVAMLVEEGKISYKDPIVKYLPADLMKDLHSYKGRDYSKDICIEHLLSNSSGLADFYEDKPNQGKPFLKLMLDEPSRYWTPEETIQWTKQNMSPRFPPGKKCHYTNTGYNLLGLVIENVTSKSYYEVLHKYIFQTLNMNHTYLSQYSEPLVQSSYPVANLTAIDKEIKVEDHHSFSSIYAGGQTVSTSEDLLKFMKALVGNQLIPNESLVKMMQWKKMWIGVDYGYGLMRVRMLPVIKKYNGWGHLGSIGSFMLYHPDMDVYMIGNFNKTGYLAKSVRFIFTILRTISNVKTG
ncbi:serine hydrolase domain-containing protein [Neobacillus soli]|uniref:serine hydrolase domain-containing protein n=1 Tax=Neobacillus soli TaxID=220688 RepID=UPI0008256CBE|nr:serine hydrolase domain-containing protein [Neobacillus soli]